MTSGLLENPIFIALSLFLVGILVLLYLLYFYDRILIKNRISKIDAVLIFFIVVMPLYSAINANFSYDQSIIDGLFTAWAKQISILFVVVYQFLIRGKKVNIGTIFIIIITFAWINTAFKFYLTLTLDPATLVNTDMVGFNPAKGGYVFRFDSSPTQIAAIFYFTNFIVTKKWYHLIGASAFLAYMLFVDKGRIDIVSLFGVMGFCMVRNLSPINFFRTLFILVVLASSTLFIVYQFAPDQILVLKNMLWNFVLTIVGIDSGETSASSRFLQFGMVFNHFAMHPEQMIFGVGILQRDEMFLRFGHLFLKDIGIVGIFFTYGIAGVIIFYGFFIYALRLTWKVKYYKRDLHYKLTESIMVMIFISSFFNGSFVWAPGGFLTYLLFLHTFTLKEMQLSSSSPPTKVVLA